MNFPLFVAGRYLVSKRKRGFIHIITGLAMTVIALAVAALIVVMSVFNGLEDLLRSLYTSFDPPIKIEATKGKTFEFTDSLKNKIARVPGVELVTDVIEDYVYVRYHQPDGGFFDEGDSKDTPKTEAEMVVTMKGLGKNFFDHHRLDGHLLGEASFEKDGASAVILGAGVRATLSVDIENVFAPLNIYYVKNPKAGALPSEMYAAETAVPVGVFSIEKHYDDNYIFVPIELAERLTNFGTKRTSLEIKLTEAASVYDVEKELKQALGASFRVLNHDEQHQDFYRLIKIEKLFGALALSVLAGVASISIFFSLMMLVIDKKKDIAVLLAMGAAPTLIRSIFFFEATLITGIGTCLGLVLGVTFCILQSTVGLVGMGLDNALVNDYPVKMLGMDFFFVVSVMAALTVATAWFPARAAGKTRALSL